jgi:hypothetical protein
LHKGIFRLLDYLNLELTVKRNKIPIVPESSKRTVLVTDPDSVGAVILAAGASTRMGKPKHCFGFAVRHCLDAPRPLHLRQDASL